MVKAKSKSITRKKSSGKQRKAPSVSMRNTVVRLDEGARRHVRLLLDPCNAPLARPAYEMSAGGLLVRYRRVINLAVTANQTAFILGFMPHENTLHLNNIALIDGSTATTVGAQECFSGLDTTSGGSQFSFRCVAGCAKLMCLTSELNRSGIVCAGSVDSDVIIPTSTVATTTADGIMAVLPVATRMPSRSLEVLWTPGENSGAYRTTDPAGASTLIGTHNNACVLVGSGLPANTGVRVELTAVYEVRPANTSNVVAVVEPPPSNNSWNQVLRAFLQEAGNRVRIEGERAVVAGISYLGQRMMARGQHIEL
jgi:hypothetical protein